MEMEPYLMREKHPLLGNIPDHQTIDSSDLAAKLKKENGHTNNSDRIEGITQEEITTQNPTQEDTQAEPNSVRAELNFQENPHFGTQPTVELKQPIEEKSLQMGIKPSLKSFGEFCPNQNIDNPHRSPFHSTDYELLEEIGRGGMGVVFRANQIKLNRQVAIKTLISSSFVSDQAKEKFRA